MTLELRTRQPLTRRGLLGAMLIQYAEGTPQKFLHNFTNNYVPKLRKLKPFALRRPLSACQRGHLKTFFHLKTSMV
jgi:hypothetical protein